MGNNLFGPFEPVITDDMALYHDDCLERLATFPANMFDSAVCDPPYHLTSIQDRYKNVDLDSDDSNAVRARKPAPNDAMARLSRGFMGKHWDGGDIAFRPDTWQAVLRVLKPGAHLVAFGGTRTAHRMKCAIEDAGFQVRDAIRYECDGTDKYAPLLDSLTDDQRAGVIELLHEAAGGSDLAWSFGSGFPKSHDAGNGWGTGLKPAHEPIILARKPLIGTVAQNVMAWGIGAINIDGCRVEWLDDADKENGKPRGKLPGAHKGFEGKAFKNGDRSQNTAAEMQNQIGRHPANVIHDGADHPWPITKGGGDLHKRSAPKTNGIYGAFAGDDDRWSGYADTGSAARFFYQAKANKADRAGSKHPTVKPIDLIAYLQRLVTPAGGLTLDMFAGSGTSVAAAQREGFRIVAIEKDVTYFCDMLRRVGKFYR